MSTLKVNKLESTGTTDGGIQLDGSGHVTVDGQQMPTAGPLSNRNLIINGSHDVNQRDLGSFTPSHNDFCSDRWRLELSQASKYTAEQSSTSPDGFRKSLKITSSSAYTPVAADYFLVTQDIEGYNSSPTAFGSSSAKSVTLSFWVRSSLTGTFACAIRNSAYNRTHIKEYTISTADTWEYKTLTFPGITDGTWNTGSTVGIRVHWALGGGSNYQGTANTTQNINAFTTSSATNVISTSGATWFMTGAQLEVGEVATPFEHRSYGDELDKCLRYYETGVCFGLYKGSDDTIGFTQYSVQKRVNPTLQIHPPGTTLASGSQGYYYSVSNNDKGNRGINEINNASWMNNQSNLKNGFFATIGGFTPENANDAMWTGNYDADAEL